MKVRSLLPIFCAAFVLGTAIPSPRVGLVSVASAQNLGERKISGTVTGTESEPVHGATVFLRSLKTKTIRSFTSLENGHFQFAQVNKAEDYDLWAEKEGKKSAVKTVSSWDARTEFVTDLKLK